MKVVITGKYGLLSTTLHSLDTSIVTLSRYEYDIADNSIITKLQSLNPDVIIHAGAVTDSNEVKRNPISAINTNIIGTANISKYCIDFNKRLVYISTDYVYDGKDGNHKETDSVFPYNTYAWTKLGGECSVRLVPNHVIIRTSFGNTKFPYDVAWDNMIVSKDYVDVIAPKILKVAYSSFIGVINVGTEPKTILEYATRRNVVTGSSLEVPLDFSLDLNLYEQSFNN
jgi:dTDP-4-dehydrorhamnose reductase